MGSFSIRWPFGRGSRSPRGTATAATVKKKDQEREDEEEEYGVTPELCDYVRGFTVNAFRDYPLQLQDDGSRELSEWQERHATLVLSKVKEVSQLRYVLCPRHLKEWQFWRIYFLLVKTHIHPYEIRAVTKAKLRMQELEVNNLLNNKSAIEVEMIDTKHASGSSNRLQCDSELLEDGD